MLDEIQLRGYDPTHAGWQRQLHVGDVRHYHCGFCGGDANSTVSLYHAVNSNHSLRFCAQCKHPTYFVDGELRLQLPRELPGQNVAGLPVDVESLYTELRMVAQVGAWHSAVMLGRLLLVRAAWNLGMPAKTDSIGGAIVWLKDNGFIVRNQIADIERIQSDSNAANHDNIFASQEQALHMVAVISSVLDAIYGSVYRRNSVAPLRPAKASKTP